MDINRITVLHIYYYFVCKRKLWYFINGLSMESENEDVKLGKLLDENSYKNSDKHIVIDGVINIDYIAEHRILHEIKKSRKIEEAGIWQLKYYLYYLKKRGVDGFSGRIDYPLMKKTLKVELLDDDEAEIERICKEIVSISENISVPEIEKKSICKKCAYYEFCHI